MTVRDKLKDKQTMTAGLSEPVILVNDPLHIHGHLATVLETDAAETLVEYEGGIRRTFATPDLATYRQLDTFPAGTRFARPVAGGFEYRYIESILPTAYVVESLDASAQSTHLEVAHTDLVDWHVGGLAADHDIALPPGAKPYVPKLAELVEAAVPSAELDAELETARRELADALLALHSQQLKYEAILSGYEADIASLEKKATILQPPPQCKEFCIKRACTERELADFTRDGWLIQHMQFMDSGSLHVVFVRDCPPVPAGDAPHVQQVVSVPSPETAAPLPVGQVIVPVVPSSPTASKWLTNNGPRPGDTRRIPALAAFEERRQRDAAEIAAILERGRAQQETLRQRFAHSTNPFSPSQGAAS